MNPTTPYMNGPMGTYPISPAIFNGYNQMNQMGYCGTAPLPPPGLPLSASQMTYQSTMGNQMMNQGLMMSNVSAFPMAPNYYETGIATSMSNYRPNMINTAVPPIPTIGMNYNQGMVVNSNSRVLINQTNSNSRVLIGGGGNSNSRIIIAPPIYNKAVIPQKQSQSRIEYIPY